MINISSVIYPKTPSIRNETRHSSAASQFSTTTNSSTSSRRYSIKSNRKSEIDETLFGKVVPMKNNNNMFPNEEINTYRPKFNVIDTIDCGRVVEPIRVITQENVRNLRVIKPATEERSLILNQKHFERLLDYQKQKEMKKNNDREEAAKSFKRKEELKQYDKLLIQRQVLNDVEKETLEENQKIIKKAWETRVDDDMDLREINEMIKNAKVQSIRAHQIAEKEVIRKERLADDLKLNQMIEEERIKAIKHQQEMDQKKLEKEYLAAISMADQRYNTAMQKIIEQEKEEEENYRFKQLMLHSIQDEKLKEQVTIKKKLKERDELTKAYIASQERKTREIIEEKLFDEKIMKIQKEKGEKEKHDEELRIEKANLREKEYAKMRALQERFRDLKSERDELLERRAAEHYQRMWREKQLEEMRKQRKTEEDLMAARIKQRHEVLVNKALEAKRDEAIFMKNLEVEKQLIEKEKEAIKALKTKKDVYAAEISKQIERNKRQRMVDNYRKAVEEASVKKEKSLQKERLEEVKQRKLEELRLLGIDEKFLIPIENQIKNLNYR